MPGAPIVLFRQGLSTASEIRQLCRIHGASPSSNPIFPSCLANFFANSSIFSGIVAHHWAGTISFRCIFDFFRNSPVSSTVKFCYSCLSLIWKLSSKCQFHDFRGAFSSSDRPFLYSSVSCTNAKWLSLRDYWRLSEFWSYFSVMSCQHFGKFVNSSGFMAHHWAPTMSFRFFFRLFWKFAYRLLNSIALTYLWGEAFPIANFAECVELRSSFFVSFCQLLQKAGSFAEFMALFRITVVLFRHIMPTISEIRWLLRLLNSITVIYLWFDARPSATPAMFVAHSQVHITSFRHVFSKISDFFER